MDSSSNLPFEIQAFVPYAHVLDVQTSIDFYKLLGLRLESRFGPEGKPFWARMKRPGVDLMLAQASGEIDSGQQAVLFYLHTDSVAAVRDHLMASGVRDSGAFGAGESVVGAREGELFDISRPHYMPAGELRVHDPDGYVLLIGQLGD